MAESRGQDMDINHPVVVDDDADPSFIYSAALVPARLFLSSLVTLIRVLRPYAPQLIPLLVCLLLVPAVILVSVFAGFLVWRNIAVPWDVPLHLQFGYVGYFILPLPELPDNAC